jgi:hypothetical protein
MYNPRLIAWGENFGYKNWEGPRAPEGAHLAVVLCWHDLDKPCTRRCAAYTQVQRSDMARENLVVYCKMLHSPLGYLIAEDQAPPSELPPPPRVSR